MKALWRSLRFMFDVFFDDCRDSRWHIHRH